MEFKETKLRGAYLVSIKKIADNRGYFGRAWCTDELARHGLNPNMVQLNTALSHKKGTVRGLHYQEAPHAEAKFMRCTRGAIFDVVVDIRKDSPTRGQWFGVELTAVNGMMLYAPEGFAHGYQTLADDTEMYYLTTGVYAPAAARGFRYNDLSFRIEWPLPPSVISEADQKWPDFS